MGDSTEIQLLGLLLVCIGVTGVFVAKKELGKEWVYASVYKSSPKKKIVMKGIYAYIRHPIYTGIVISYVGAELVAGSWLWVSALFFFIPFFYQAKKEEKFLMEKFGNQYKKYREKTKMFVPYIW
jgi:protein-S-isoprenylcysteine O-methyltransferase Ste14